jgi:hypothetical protein
VDHHSRHVAERSERSRKHVLEQLRGRSDHDDLPREHFRGDLPTDDARVGDAREGVRRARVVDPELRVTGQGRRPDSGGLGESVDLQVESRILAVLKVDREAPAADEGVTVGEDIDRTPRGRAGAELRERRLDLLQLLDPAGVPDLAQPGRQDDLAGSGDGLGERLVVGGPRDDGSMNRMSRRSRPLPRLTMSRNFHGAPRRGAHVELDERVLVDGDDHDRHVRRARASQRRVLTALSSLLARKPEIS